MALNKHRDRRDSARFEIVGTLWGSLEFVDTMCLRNISRSGTLVEARTPLPVGSVHPAEVVWQGHVHRVRVQVCRVTRIDSDDGVDRFLLGLQFLELPGEAERQITEAVRAALGKSQESPVGDRRGADEQTAGSPS